MLPPVAQRSTSVITAEEEGEEGGEDGAIAREEGDVGKRAGKHSGNISAK